MEETRPIVLLNSEEQRVLGALLEKSRTTPDYYPMTINSLTAACNQKTSRNPVVNFSEETVTLTLNALKIKGLASTVTASGSRAVKWKHNLAIYYPLLPADLSIICLLLLRGPLTPGEINTSSGRLYEFDTIEEVQENLERLSSNEPAFVKQLQKRPGQKEARYMQLFGGSEIEEAEEISSHFGSPADSQLEERIAKLEAEVKDLKAILDQLL
jgi:uncharacterized protein YceH (UPF0502 family)